MSKSADKPVVTCRRAHARSRARCDSRSRSTADGTSSPPTSPSTSAAPTAAPPRTNCSPPRSHPASRRRSRCTPARAVWEIGDVRVDVDYDHRSTPRRFTIVLQLDPSIPPERVERLVKVAESCPVRRAIESGIEFDERVVAAQLTPAMPLD